MKKNPPLDLVYINSRLRVNITTGKCFWKDPSKAHIQLTGREAGCKRHGGGSKFYWMIKLGGVAYRRSHIVYAIKTSSWPCSNLDHRNGDSLDDRAKNLRTATPLENARNRKIGALGRNLPMGVRSLGARFQARISVKNKQIHLGSFPSIELAHSAYRKARRQYFGGFA